jgi:hypothetical protein
MNETVVMTQDDIVYLLDVAERHGMVGRDAHGCVSLTAEGGAVMRDQEDMPTSLSAVLEASLEQGGPTRRAPTMAKSSSSSSSSSSGTSAT